MSKPTLIFATFLAPVLYKTWLYITEYVERYVGIPTFLLPGEHLEDFAAGYIDAGFISGLSYVHLSSQDPCPVELLATPSPPSGRAYKKHCWSSIRIPFSHSDYRKEGSSSFFQLLMSNTRAFERDTGEDKPTSFL